MKHFICLTLIAAFAGLVSEVADGVAPVRRQLREPSDYTPPKHFANSIGMLAPGSKLTVVGATPNGKTLPYTGIADA